MRYYVPGSDYFVTKDGKEGILDSSGRTALEPLYDKNSVWRVTDDLFKVELNGRRCYVGRDGRQFWE